MPALVLLAALLAAGAALAQPPESLGALRPHEMSVAHPGRVLIDPPQRTAQLKRLDAMQRRRLCPPATIDPDLPPVLKLAGSVDATQRGTSTARRSLSPWR